MVAKPKMPAGLENIMPKSMGKTHAKTSWAEWLRQFPSFRFPSEPNESFMLVNEEDLQELFAAKQVDPNSAAAQRVKEDLDHLNKELMPLFRERDFISAREQNRYRLFQLSFMLLASLATAIGSLQVWALTNARDAIVVLGLMETVVALVTTFIATLKGNRQPLPSWLENRRMAEQLRREYFRYLTDTPPYNGLDGSQRRRRLARRAAAINNREDPNIITD